MKKTIFSIIAALATLQALAQDKDITQRASVENTEAPGKIIIQGLKTYDEAQPRVTVDFNYRQSFTYTQKLEMIDLSQSYTQSLSGAGQRDIQNPVFSDGRSQTVDMQLGFFLFKKRNFGIGTGLMYSWQSGTMTMDNFHVEYKESKVLNDKTLPGAIEYRQIISSAGKVQEDIRTSNITIPLMLKFRQQFGKWNSKKGNYGKIGISADLGYLLGVQNTTRYSTASRFNYEAVYLKSNQNPSTPISGYNTDVNPSTSNTLLLINGPKTDHMLDDDYTNGGYNVGLNKGVQPGDGKTSYTKLSHGVFAQLAATYSLGYRTSLMLGLYYMYQINGNTGNDQYRITDKLSGTTGANNIGNYNSMTDGMKKAQSNNFGFVAGIRFFPFGKPRDIDRDNVYDKHDPCPDVWGNSNGCPDTDGDGIIDKEDKCPSDPGSVRGCPDSDGDAFADDEDNCPDKPGRYGGCPIEETEEYKKGNIVLVNRNVDTFATPYDVLSIKTIQFDFGKAVIDERFHPALDSAITALSGNDQLVLLISGYTDNVGSWDKNMKLSFERANAVKQYLTDNGVDNTRIITAGYGTDNPVAPNDNDESRAQNRRIEMKLLLPLKKKTE